MFVCEGEKDVDRLRTLGLAATCNSEGAEKFRPELAKWLENRRVALTEDHDESGERHVQKTAAILATVAEWVKVVCFPEMPKGGDVSDWLDAGHIVEELMAMVEEASRYRLAMKASSGIGESTRPTIIVNNRHLRDISADALNALEAANGDEPSLFIRGGVLVRLQIDETGASSKVLSHADLKGALDRAANFMKENGQGEAPARPPMM